MLKRRRPLRVGVLCSRRAPGLSELLERSGGHGAFEVACCLTSEEDFAERHLARRAGIESLSHCVRAYHRAQGAPLSDRTVRSACDEITAKRLAPFELDVVLLAGYLYVLTPPMLDAFPGGIFNVHGSDLLPRDPAGRPKYPGLRAVRDAIVAGEGETRASLHLVTEALDEGPVLLRSWPFAVSPLAADAREANSRETLHAYAFAHQEWMLRKAWGPLFVHGLELVADDRLRLENGRFHLGLSRGPWELSEGGGFRLESPDRLRRVVGE